MFTVTTRIVAVALAAAAAASTVPAAATPLGQAPRAVVRHGDLDLATASGVAKLQGRVAVAAAKVCGVYDAVDLKEKAAVLTCRKETIAAVSPKVELAVASARRGEALSAAGGAAAISIP